MSHTLRLNLLRDTAFGRGDGVAGLVDAEVEHDEFGLPFLRGRALKGVLVYECADILFALQQQQKLTSQWEQAARFLFGEPGSTLDGNARLRVGNAVLPAELRQVIAYQMEIDRAKAGELRADVLNGLTTIRRQTAINPETGVAKDNSLRATRLILRQTSFEASLTFVVTPPDRAKGLLAACVKALHRAGTRRHRGPGLLEASLHFQGTPITDEWFALFKHEVSQ